jgi:bifunctional DNA-binding transcriptional regulator/antitoxin component of YhaV-PrlF toxin-antitoxin module
MVKVQEGSNNQRLVTIPRELAKAMGLEKGEEVEFTVKDSETLELKKRG